MSKEQSLSRRDFLRASALAAVGVLAASCAQPTPQVIEKEVPVEKVVKETVVVEKEVPVEKVVKETVVVEKEVSVEKVVTATPVPVRFKEAPMLAELVKAGKLPPVEERLPVNPLVAVGLDGIGKYGGTWRMGKGGQADTYARGQVIQRGLLNIDHNLKIVSQLAESWDVSPDGREWTFHLRKGLKWSDGTPMTSEDFRFWYEDIISNREYTPAHPTAYVSFEESERVPATFLTLDEYTFQYKFTKPKSLFYYTGSIINTAPVAPAHFLKPFHPRYANKDALSKMVADGKYDNWTQLFGDKNDISKTMERPTYEPWLEKNPWADEFVWLERNPYFWEVDTEGNQLPYIDKLQYRNFSDSQVYVMWCVNGEIDCQGRHAGGFQNYTVLKEGEKTGDYTVQIWRATRIASIHFNMTCKDPRKRELFSQRDFRIAISLGVNRQEMIDMLLEGFATPMQYVPPKDSPYHYPKLANAYLDYDPDRANALLDKLGYTQRDKEGYRLWKDGSGERISITCLGGGTDPSSFVLMLMDYFKDLGLELNFRGADRALRIEMHQSNEVEMTAGDADRNLVPLADPQIWTKHTNINDRPWCNAYTAWYMDPTHPIAERPPDGHWIWDIWHYWEEIQQTVDEEKQKELFFKILDIWAEELPSIGLYGDQPRLIVVKNGLKGIHAGYPWDCCSTAYEHIIDNATWYWDEPEKHTF